MKRLIVCVAAMLLAGTTFAQIKWEEGTLNQALKKPRKAVKNLYFWTAMQLGAALANIWQNLYSLQKRPVTTSTKSL